MAQCAAPRRRQYRTRPRTSSVTRIMDRCAYPKPGAHAFARSLTVCHQTTHRKVGDPSARMLSYGLSSRGVAEGSVLSSSVILSEVEGPLFPRQAPRPPHSKLETF